MSAMDHSYTDISKMIDHSLLNPTLTEGELAAGCQLARDYDVATAMVMPYYLPRAVQLLAGSTVVPSTVIGFPHGSVSTASKAAETRLALAAGAKEIDMVVNISKVRSGDWDYVGRDIEAVNDLVHGADARLKVIFENCFLDDAEKIRLCEICGDLGVDWVKTSTGYGATGATHADLKLMRAHSPAHVQIKAAGGVRDLDALLAVRALGVSRVGATVTKAILDEYRRRYADAVAA